MRLLKKSIPALLLVLSFFTTTAFAITNADTMRVFKKVYQDPTFLPQLYEAVPLYHELSVTEASVNAKFKDSIHTVLTIAETEKAEGVLTEENLKARLKNITIDTAASMEAVYIALCTDAFSEETVASLLDGNIPQEFEPLYLAIASEAYVILGFGKKGEPTHVFDDLGNHLWAEKAIAYLFDKDILNGVSDFSFMPAANVTREQFAKMMCVAFQIEASSEKPSFTDVWEQDWFYPYVTAMASRKLILGIGDRMVGTGQNITRQDMAVLMFRIGEMLGIMDRSSSKTSGFEDDRYIASYARTAVITMKELGIINGNELNCFNPTMSATRAEAAQMLYRFHQFVNK